MQPITFQDFERLAADALPAGALGFYAGGAADELTLRDNVEAWRRIAIRPRTMVDVSERDSATTLLGARRPHPVVVAPMAFHKLADPEAEVGSARAAAAVGAPFCLSTFSTTTAAELTAAVPDAARWFQLYVFRDRAVTRELVAAATDHGFEAIVLTVDLPMFGWRERDLRSGFAVDAVVPSLGGRRELTVAEIGALIDPSLTWGDVELLADECPLPVVVKGVLTPEDARRAAKSGVAGVVVSNHGGRQLDTVLAGADALPAVVEEVGEELDVLVDGGVRRGTDVLKALALGASAVMMGRPVLWGLTVAGTDGVRRVLEILLAEFDIALGLAGAPVAAELDATWIER